MIVCRSSISGLMYELNHKLWNTFYEESVLPVSNDWIINGILEFFLGILEIACNYWYPGVQFSAIQLANLLNFK